MGQTKFYNGWKQNSSPKFCAETIEKFEKNIDKNYNKIFIKIANSESQKILVNMMDKFFDQNKTMKIQIFFLKSMN